MGIIRRTVLLGLLVLAFIVLSLVFAPEAQACVSCTGSINGMKFADLDRNGSLGGDDFGLQGWRIFIDLNTNGRWDSGEPYDITNEEGYYRITGVPLYIPFLVCEESNNRWEQTLPSGSGPRCGRGSNAPTGYLVYLTLSNIEITGKKFGNYPQNPTCEDLNSNYSEFKIDGAPFNGTFPVDSIGSIVVSTNDDKYFDWTSSFGMDAVIAKGGPAANIYTYDPEAFADQGLHSPALTPSGNIPTLSHISFCYDTGEAPPGSIEGHKYVDDEGDYGIEGDSLYTASGGWTINLYDSLWNILASAATVDGSYSFTGLEPGTYYVCEAGQAGWVQTYPSDMNAGSVACANEGTVGWEVSVASEQTVSNVDFGNFEEAEIEVCKYEDLNGNHERNRNDPALEGWTVNLYDEEDNLIGTGQTDANGCYKWTGLGPGDYTVEEEVKTDEGWMASNDPSHTFKDITSGSSNLYEFLNYRGGGISGHKWEDLDSDGEWDEGEPALAGWTIWLFSRDGEQSTTTGEGGYYSFTDLEPGNYVVCEVLKENWNQTYPYGEADDDDSVDLAESTTAEDGFINCESINTGSSGVSGWGHRVRLPSGTSVTDRDFGNDPHDATIYGTKFNDLNGNGVWEDGEPGLAGWIIFVDYNDNGIRDEGEPYAETDENGNYTITGIKPQLDEGEFWTIYEVTPGNWVCTFPTPCYYERTLGPGAEEDGVDFGNYEPPSGDDDDDDDDITTDDDDGEAVLPFLGPGISKLASVDTAGLGDTVTWTIQATRPDGPSEVLIQDTVPDAFDVVNVTATAGTVSVVGNVVTVDIGTVAAGETVTVTLETVVNQDAPAGEVCNEAALGALSAEYCVDVFPLELPPLGSQPVNTPPWTLIGLAAALLALGGILLKRRMAA